MPMQLFSVNFRIITGNCFKSIFKRDKRIISGHWSAIELHKHPYGSSIDSACIWGKKLTALCLEDNKTYTVEVNNKDLN